MKIVVTAGNTLVPIDRVRCITNIFTGRTGAQIALQARASGHDVTLLTSHPEVLDELNRSDEQLQVQRYRTFEDLQTILQHAIQQTNVDALIHCAAVSDYLAGGIFAPSPATRFDVQNRHWTSASHDAPSLVDRQAGKVKSDEPELWLRLVRAPKLVDLVRSAWGFAGILVKFKLEVGVPEEQLLTIAERSRVHSAANLMVANTLEGAEEWAYLGPVAGGYQRVPRAELAASLLEAIEYQSRECRNG